MKPVSQLLRGAFYSTHLTARCAEYQRCLVCGGCRRYDANNLTCVTCQRGRATEPCRCKPSALMAVRLMTAKMGYEISHPDAPSRGRVVTLEEDRELLEFIEQNIGLVSEER